MLLEMLKDQNINFIDNKETAVETEMVEKETRAILDRVIELGDGDVTIGAVRAFEAGVLDQTFATTCRALRKVLGVRDAQGAVRYLDHGNLPFSKEIINFHKEKIVKGQKRKAGRLAMIPLLAISLRQAGDD